MHEWIITVSNYKIKCKTKKKERIHLFLRDSFITLIDSNFDFELRKTNKTTVIIKVNNSTSLKAWFQVYNFEMYPNGIPATTAPMLADKEAMAWDVPEKLTDVNSIAITPSKAIEP